MEGVVDATVRDLWTALGGFDRCFTEFIRVTNQKIPDHVFFRECPELEVACQNHHKARTPCGTPVIVQLLGGDPDWLAENAIQAIALGSPGLDLNFGCPAPTVNRHDGGASLLQYPERIFKIVEKVRSAVPREFPVTAKMRLGFMDTALCLENAEAIQAAGAAELTVHCRTKKQMYQPPADWSWLPRLKERLHIPLIANGEIWSAQDAKTCLDLVGVVPVMIGRGALSDPWLGLKIKGQLEDRHEWSRFLALTRQFFRACERQNAAYTAARVKQMVRYFTKHSPEAAALFEKIKIQKHAEDVLAFLH